MLDALFIALRESAELALVCCCLLDCLRHQLALRTALLTIASGAVLGVVAGGTAVVTLDLPGLPPALQAGTGILIAVVILFVTKGMLESVPKIERSVAFSLPGHSPAADARAAFGISALAGLRESAEVAAQLAMLAPQVGLAEALQALMAGAVFGAIICVGWQRLRYRVGIRALFRASALLLAVIAIDLLVGSVGDLVMLSRNPAAISPATLEWVEHFLRVVLIAAIAGLAALRWWRDAK